MFDILKQIFDAIKGFFQFTAEGIETLINLITTVYTFFTSALSLITSFFPSILIIVILLCVVIAVVYKIVGR